MVRRPIIVALPANIAGKDSQGQNNVINVNFLGNAKSQGVEQHCNVLSVATLT